MVTVAVGAFGGIRVAASDRFAVNAVGVGLENGDFEPRRLGQLPLQMTLAALNFLGVAGMGQLGRVNVLMAVGAAEFAVNRLAENLLVNENAPLPPANIKPVKFWVAVALLTGANFRIPGQFRCRSFNPDTLSPNKRQQPTSRQKGCQRPLTHVPSMHLQSKFARVCRSRPLRQYLLPSPTLHGNFGQVAFAAVTVGVACDAKLLLKLPDAVFAFDAFSLRQFAVSLHEIPRVRHGQLVAIKAGVASVANGATCPGSDNPLRVGLPEIWGVRWRSLAVALPAVGFVPSVATLAQNQIFARLGDMDVDEVFGVRHFGAVAVGAKLLGVASPATLRAFSNGFQSVTAFDPPTIPRLPSHKVGLLVGLGFLARVAVVAELFRVAC